jgi:hypothetical protein
MSAACVLSHILIPSISFLALEVGRKVVVAWSEIRAVRSVTKQLRAEMLQQCSSGSNCIRTCMIMVEHYIRCQHSMPFSSWMALHCLFSVLQYTSDLIVVPCYMNFAINIPLLSQEMAAITFLASRQCLFRLFWLVWWMCVHPLLWLFCGFNIHKRDPGFINCYSYNVTEKSIAIFCSKSMPKLFSASHVHRWAFSEPVLHKTCDSLV